MLLHQSSICNTQNGTFFITFFDILCIIKMPEPIDLRIVNMWTKRYRKKLIIIPELNSYYMFPMGKNLTQHFSCKKTPHILQIKQFCIFLLIEKK